MKKIDSTQQIYVFFRIFSVRRLLRKKLDSKKIIVHFLINLLFYSYNYSTFCQNSFLIKGKIVDIKDNKPVPFSTVFLDGTTISATADSSGFYQIVISKTGEYTVATTMIGYKLSKKNITISGKLTNYSLDFFLESKEISLDEIQIKGQRDKSWEKNYKRFEKLFLENKFGKEQVIVRNKEVINFEVEDNVFKAHSLSSVKVENFHLGYLVNIYLEEFRQEKNFLKFITTTSFEEMIPSDLETQKNWIKHREEAYLGSLRHFFSALYKDRLSEQGFDAHLLRSNAISSLQNLSFYGNFERYQPLLPDKILQKVENSDKKKFHS